MLEDINRIKRTGDGMIDIDSSTSRTNSLPTHAVVMSLAADVDAAVKIELRGTWGEEAFNRSLTIGLNELRISDRTIQVSPVFSAPRLEIHRLCPGGSRIFNGEWSDPEPGEDDSYFIKVLQKNGHMAWNSPIWCRKER